ncbi:hypothetical protein CRENPOLYSF2_4410002 [Crenothrix polyspora]|uniref:Uncharacterized protein n=1 Tax=Crenothrix polyspora TaxID=360316 RepID=A0A1R4HFE2_9GAMM|nr:hypothetical protein CRENPOLYSF2_4410002 [Crenothrix polyspora]
MIKIKKNKNLTGRSYSDPLFILKTITYRKRFVNIRTIPR